MANPSTAPSQAASAVVDEATRRYLELTSQLNRDLFAHFTAAAEALLDCYVAISKTTLKSINSFVP